MFSGSAVAMRLKGDRGTENVYRPGRNQEAIVSVRVPWRVLRRISR